MTSQGGAVRSAAARALDGILASKAPARRLLSLAGSGLGARDRNLLEEIVLGSLRWLRRLDFVLERAAGRPLAKIDPDLLSPFRVALYQILFLERVPAHAAVNAAVSEIKTRSHRGAAGFANAVLRRVARDPELASWPVDVEDPIERLAIETSYPGALVGRWVERFGDPAASAALEAGNRRAGYQLLVIGDRGAVAEELAVAGVETEPASLAGSGLVVKKGDPRATTAFSEGKLYVQDQASQVAALIPPLRLGERILDVAAAPGGKSFALATARKEAPALLVGSDLSLPRLLRMRENQKRIGLSFPLAVFRAEEPGVGVEFDRVVVDLPCSGTGTFARHPELKWRYSASELERMARQSLAMLSASADLVASGGLLCALTCSLEHEENEAVIERFLAGPEGRVSQRRFELEDLELPAAFTPHIRGPGFWRLLPSVDHDGFTVHVLRRRD